FEIGMVMAGAISAGAYSAGVFDFLIEALDAWEAEKAKPGYAGPRHDAVIKVLTGASAGAMTASIAAVALQSETEPVRDVDNPPEASRNRFYDAWVRRVDATCLLRDEDIQASGKVMSLLDSTELDRIAGDALKTTIAPKLRRFVADPLAIFLTVANLRGVPYAFNMVGAQGGAPYGMLAHADHVKFAVSRAGRTLPAARQLEPSDAPGGSWPMLARSALASGAFPVGLQSRVLEGEFGDYDHRYEVKPFWGEMRPQGLYKFLCVDGGLMNNEPLELARAYLADGGRNPREGGIAYRAVVMVDPFPNKANFKAEFTPDDRIMPVVSGMFGSLIDQARFKPEELQLAMNPDIYSRFVISPSRTNAQDKNVEPAMASAILGGFGGFLCEPFRRHDFQLARRNCQQFLRRHFCLPETNPLFKDFPPSAREPYYTRDSVGQFDRFAGPDSPRMLPIIPLEAQAKPAIAPYAVPNAKSVDLDALEDLLETRIKKVVATLIDGDLSSVIGGSIVRWGARTAFNMKIAPKLRDKLRAAVETQLATLG
ncbi:MAG: patatin-like phospholipase family protein, partial [Alphaproteobacteria bacterium]